MCLQVAEEAEDGIRVSEAKVTGTGDSYQVEFWERNSGAGK